MQIRRRDDGEETDEILLFRAEERISKKKALELFESGRLDCIEEL